MQFLHGGHGVETIRIVGPFRFMDSMRRGEGKGGRPLQGEVYKGGCQTPFESVKWLRIMEWKSSNPCR